MRKSDGKRWQAGQILPIMAFVVVLLLGITALAIDGSMIYSDRRVAQNASDAAALAGAGMAAQYLENHSIRYDNFTCSNPEVIQAMNTAVSDAIARAATNDFAIDGNIANKNGVIATCSVVNAGPYMDEYIDVTVLITITTRTSFAQLFYSGPIKNTVESIVRVHPRTNLGYGYAIGSLGNDCSSGGITAVGNASVTTTNAGIFSNSCLSFSGNVDVNVSDPMNNGIRYVTTYSTVGGVSVDPTPVQSAVSIVPYNVPAPDCSVLPYMGSVDLKNSQVAMIDPGRYDSITLGGSSRLTLNPGLYCLYGDIFLSGGQTLTGYDVTIYFVEGSYYSAGNSIINLTAPNYEGTPTNPVIRGMLFYAAVGNTDSFTISGTSNSTYQGTIFAPSAPITAIGTSGLDAIKSQIIGKKIYMDGDTALNIDFDGALNYQVPASLDTMK
jgi:Flp pilus assembly protein TadG